MATFASFEDMKVWQKTRVLSRIIRGVCKRKNVCRDYGFVDQISRAVRSISYNIAEGCDAQTNGEFVTFLGYAKRSASEVRAQLYDALDEQYITHAEFRDLMDQVKIIGKMLTTLMQYLRNNKTIKL